MDFVSGCKHAATISVDAFRSFIEANELVVRCGVLSVAHGSMAQRSSPANQLCFDCRLGCRP